MVLRKTQTGIGESADHSAAHERTPWPCNGRICLQETLRHNWLQVVGDVEELKAKGLWPALAPVFRDRAALTWSHAPVLDLMHV